MSAPTIRYGLDLRRRVADHLGPKPRVAVDAVVAEARRALNILLYQVIMIHEDRVEIQNPSVDVVAALRTAWDAIDLDVLVAELSPCVVELTVSGKDFERLAMTTMRWGPHWQPLIDSDRFEATPPHDEPIRTDWGFAHWFGDQWQAVMTARAYLDGIGHGYQILWDVAEEDDGTPFGYVILTDHGSPTWELLDKRGGLHLPTV